MQVSDQAQRAALEAAFKLCLSYLDKLDGSPVASTAAYTELMDRLKKPLSDAGVPADQVVAELARDVEGGLLGSTGGRFFAWVIGGSLPSALASDWLTSAWDQNAGMFAVVPAAAVVEEVAGEWLKEIFGLPQSAAFALVTGCQMAHFTCLAAARHALLERQGWNVEERGLYGAPRIRILANASMHGTFERTVKMLGMGQSQIVRVAVGKEERMLAGALERALAEERKANSGAPILVLMQAGEINTGAFDPFESLVPIAHRYDAWVHIDGAFGLWAAASKKYRHFMAAAGTADSWATDGHKWLNVPYDCGYAFVADSRALHAAMSPHQESYLTHATVARDQIDWNPEWSRRGRGFATYAALRELGRTGVEGLIERCCAYALALVDGMGALDGAEVLWRPTINQGLVRFPDPSPHATGQDHDRMTDAAIAAINKTGEAFFGGTMWRGKRAMRVSVCNWRTGEADVRRTIAAVASVLGR